MLLTDDLDARMRHDAAAVDLDQDRSQCLCRCGIGNRTGVPAVHASLTDQIDDALARFFIVARNQYIAFDDDVLL